MSISVTFDYDIKKRKGILQSTVFPEVREYFSVKIPKFGAARYNKHIPDRKYVITATGRFDVGLYWEIYKYINRSYVNVEFLFTDEFRKVILLKYDVSVLNRGLRDYQEDIVQKCLNCGMGTVVLATAGGKAQPLSCKIKTPTGWTLMGDIKIGDEVSTPDGNISKVVNIFPQGKKEIYKVTFDDDRYTECCIDHLWKVFSYTKYSGWTDNWNVVSTKDLISISKYNTNKRKDGGMAVRVPLIEKDPTPDKEYPIHPYVVGCLLGDGTLTVPSIGITSADKEIIDNIQALIPSIYQLHRTTKIHYLITLRDKKHTKYRGFNNFIKKIGLYGCDCYNKFIPAEYLNGSLSQRISLLQGILDTDGYAGKGGAVCISVTSERLAKDIVQLVRSIGGISKIRRVYKPTFTYNGAKKVGAVTYTVSVIHSRPDTLVTLKRKKDRLSCVRKNRDLKLRIKSIENTGKIEDCQCISIDSKDHLYITDDYIVTHNTFTMASLVESINPVKCLIIVPDPGLVEQTYNDFIKYGIKPERISRWTGVHEIHNEANIVIANRSILQSKCSDTEWIKYVDLVLVDEVQTLKKDNGITDIVSSIITPHKYGFTGTLPENDIDRWTIMGITGPIIYQRKAHELREDKYVSEVKALILKLHYKSFIPEITTTPNEAYRKELEWLIRSEFRTNTIGKICGNFNKNALLLVDRLEHGEVLKSYISNLYPDRQVYFINGEMEVEDRERIKKIMETDNNVLCIAMSKIFAVGISINNLHYIIFCSGGKSRVRVIQSIGRGLRLHKSKSILTIIDIADQLKYGILHSDKRKLLYNEEKIPFTETELTEP